MLTSHAQTRRMSTRDMLRGSQVTIDEEAIDGLYEAVNPNHFNEDLKRFAVRRQSRASSLDRKQSERQFSVSDYSSYDHENNMDDVEFESAFAPEDMRCLALVAHNHMKPAMREFVEKNKNVLKKFRLTGTNTTMTMLTEVFADDPAVKYGPTCQSGPLGGDAELVALMVMEELGGQIFLQDPMDAHPHRADIDCLNRQANVHDILQASNPSTAYGMIGMLRMALRSGNRGLLASFFETEYSPSVVEFLERELTVKESTTTNKIVRDLSVGENILAIKEENTEYRGSRRRLEERAISASFIGSSGLTQTRDDDFKSVFAPEEMRLLALVAHDHMLPALRRFIIHNKNLLKKFVLTGNKDTEDIFSEVYEGDDTVKFGPVCQLDFLGGNAQLCALMGKEVLGGLVFFQDPMHCHPHQADIDCVIRQCNVHDIYLSNNVSSAYVMMSALRRALEIGNKHRILSFFKTKTSLSVEEFRRSTKLNALVRGLVVNGKRGSKGVGNVLGLRKKQNKGKPNSRWKYRTT